MKCCISSYSYIKPQLALLLELLHGVVYLLIPTSNRNRALLCLRADLLYIFLFLHQTATKREGVLLVRGCISSYSYIKPQQARYDDTFIGVVYLLIPTSNRNYP